MRERLLVALLALAAACVVVGVASLSTPAGWIAAGVLLAAWAWLVLGDIE